MRENESVSILIILKQMTDFSGFGFTDVRINCFCLLYVSVNSILLALGFLIGQQLTLEGDCWRHLIMF